jgi:superfamily II DNA/RNA helicase
MTFESLGLSPAMLETLAKKGFEEPTPIQALAIPRLLVPGPAIAARARTGTGKTAAFGIPLIETLGTDGPIGRTPASALILVPTRELALQVTEEIS